MGLSVIVAVLISLSQIVHVSLAVGPQCPPLTAVGDYQTTAATNVQTGHGASTTTVLLDSQYTFQCCGVVTAWQYQVYNNAIDGCEFDGNCYMDFMVWKSPDPSVPEATLVGVNTVPITPTQAGSIFSTSTILLKDQVPVQPGYTIGINGFTNGVLYHEDQPVNTCSGVGLPCTTSYMETAPTFQINVPPYNYVKPYPFTRVGGKGGTLPRYYYITAITDVGYAPQFTTIPSQITIPSTTPVGTTVFKVLYTDNNTLDTLTSVFRRACPISTPFAYDPVTGAVTLNGSLTSAPYLTHTLMFDVTDQCQTTAGNLDITVVGPTNTSTSSSSSSSSQTASQGGLLSTTDGKVLVGLLATTLGLMLASLLGLCCLCYLLRGSLGCPGALGGLGGGGSLNAGASAQAYGPVQPYYTQYQQPVYQQTQNYAPANVKQTQFYEPRPPSYRNEEMRLTNRVRPEPMNDTTPREVHMRPVSPNQYYRDQLFW